MNLITALENIDQKIVLAINGLHTPLLDQIMFYASVKWIMIPFYLLLIYLLQKNFGWKNTGTIILLAIVLVIITDLTCTYLFKETVLRYRPSHNLLIKDKLHIVNDYRGGEYGFISSHAANMMAIATFTILLLRKKVRHFTWIAISIVVFISLSRIYLGAHYLSDVLVGILVGAFYGDQFYRILKKSNLIQQL